ncbi:MAG: hypothetical protein V1723_00980 [Candidatus Uhrbacteria bacterium]
MFSDLLGMRFVILVFCGLFAGFIDAAFFSWFTGGYVSLRTIGLIATLAPPPASATALIFMLPAALAYGFSTGSSPLFNIVLAGAMTITGLTVARAFSRFTLTVSIIAVAASLTLFDAAVTAFTFRDTVALSPTIVLTSGAAIIAQACFAVLIRRAIRPA